MNEYITTSTNLIANEDFKCSLLVKKGLDVTSLSFISYKIDVCEEKCTQLSEEEFWPDGFQIRPFVPPKPTFGDFMTTPGETDTQRNKKAKQTEGKNVDTNADRDSNAPNVMEIE